MDSIQTNPILLWLFLLTLGVSLGLLIIVLVAAKLVAAIRTLRGDAEGRHIGPQPFVVQEAQQYATREDVEKLAELFNHYMENAARDSAAQRRDVNDRIHENQQAMLDKLDETRVELEGKITEVHGRVDTLPDRVLTILRNTGVIK